MLQFKKQGEQFIIEVDGKQIGRIYRDEKKNYQFNHIAEFNFMIQGYNNTASAGNWKQVKEKAEKLYSNLINIQKKYGHEIISE